MRNWHIRNLRALHALCHSLTGERREAAMAAVDAELALMGAMTTAEKRAAARLKITRTDIPF